MNEFFSAIELQEEGKNAIESPTSPTIPDIGPEGYQLGKVILNVKKFAANEFSIPFPQFLGKASLKNFQ